MKSRTMNNPLTAVFETVLNGVNHFPHFVELRSPSSIRLLPTPSKVFQNSAATTNNITYYKIDFNRILTSDLQTVGAGSATPCCRCWLLRLRPSS